MHNNKNNYESKDNNEVYCESPNHSIGCTVFQCAYHCKDEDYCSLEKIEVVTHENNPTMVQCTDCGSFALRD